MNLDKVQNYTHFCKILGIKEVTLKDFSFLPEYQRKQAVANSKIMSIVKHANEGWIPDFANSSEYKYLPYFQKNRSGWSLGGVVAYYYSSYFSVWLFYKSRELANQYINKFIDIYLESME